MADISIRQAHQLSMENAKDAARKMADQMAAEYDMAVSWKGNMLNFERSGLSGTLVLHEEEAHLEVTLGFLFKAFSARIEEKMAQNMGKIFGGKA